MGRLTLNEILKRLNEKDLETISEKIAVGNFNVLEVNSPFFGGTRILIEDSTGEEKAIYLDNYYKV